MTQKEEVVGICENCQGTGFDPRYIKEYQRKGFTKDMEKDPDGYNILKCRICKGTGESDEKPKFYNVVDCYNTSHHYGYGVMAKVYTRPEAEALKAVLDGTWDGCEGSFKIKIVPVYERDFGLEQHKHYLCRHKWGKRPKSPFSWIPKEKMRILEKGLFVCNKCGDRRRTKDGKLPAYDGIGYWDEEKGKFVIPKKKQFVKVKEETQ